MTVFGMLFGILFIGVYYYIALLVLTVLDKAAKQKKVRAEMMQVEKDLEGYSRCDLDCLFE
jgi:uncharacterized membrane protein YiaA